MRMDDVFDLCVIGAGLIGSAAAKHASLLDGCRTCLIGPSEPTDKKVVEIHGAWFDEGRITRSMSRNNVWSYFGGKSAERFKDIQEKSGIDFFTEVGALDAGVPGEDFLKSTKRVCEENEFGTTEFLTRQELQRNFPFLNFPANTEGVYQQCGAGHVSPRHLVAAQQTIAKSHGCKVISSLASSIERTPDWHVVCTQDGQKIRAKKVLLAMGAYSAIQHQLLQQDGGCLDVQNVTETVAKVQISSNDAEKLRSMPSIIYVGSYWGNNADKYTKMDAGQWMGHFHRDRYCCYILPPIKYPNGNWYVKIGHGDVFSRKMNSLAHMTEWYHGSGDKDAVSMMVDDLLCLLPTDILPMSVVSDACCTSRTPSRLPFIDILPRENQSRGDDCCDIGVACGGNGNGANSSDEIGRIAALLIAKGVWTCPHEQKLFKVKFKDLT